MKKTQNNFKTNQMLTFLLVLILTLAYIFGLMMVLANFYSALEEERVRMKQFKDVRKILDLIEEDTQHDFHFANQLLSNQLSNQSILIIRDMKFPVHTRIELNELKNEINNIQFFEDVTFLPHHFLHQVQSSFSTRENFNITFEEHVIIVNNRNFLRNPF